MTTIAIADDYTIVRQALRSLFEDITEFVVVGEAGSGSEAITLVKEAEPDVLILDMVLGDITGIDVTRQLRDESPETGIIIYSMYSDQRHISGAKQAGVRGYVLKMSSPYELIEAIRSVASGGNYFPDHQSPRYA
jgi:DNA-binding NarL/FixJ family response regulator